jgi:gas vesicle protein
LGRFLFSIPIEIGYNYFNRLQDINLEVKMRKFGNFMLGAILGGLVGSTLAMLFAPASGEKARNEIKDYFSNIKDEINRAADEKRAELEMELHRLRSGEKTTIEDQTV